MGVVTGARHLRGNQLIKRKVPLSGNAAVLPHTRPDDVGNAVVLLCTPEASWITGQVIGVDGGSSLMDTLLPLDLQRG